ncbi:hypothetical protein H5410_014672, partial [Solanum commersonii]
VGNGGKTLLWEDVRVGQETLKNKYPDLFNLSLQKVSTIREMRDNQGWDLRFRRQHLNNWEINKVAELLNILEQYKDLTPISQSGGWPWKIIWKVKIFINLRGISWTMPRSIKEALACWNRDGNQSGHDGSLSQPAFGGLYGWKGTRDVSKTRVALCRTVSPFFFFGVHMNILKKKRIFLEF